MSSARSANAAWTIAALTVVADQVTKIAITTSLTPGRSVPLIPSVLHLTYVQNTGAAFGLFKGMTPVFIVLSVVVAAWILTELYRVNRDQRGRSPSARGGLTPSRMWAFALILGGAVGNLIDRLWHGHVVDFIDVRVWPVFNIADSAITIGVVLLLLPMLLARRRT